MRAERGFQMIEVVVCLAVMSVLLTLAAPSFLEMSGNRRVHLAAQELQGTLRLARAWAVRYSANVAVKFDRDEQDYVTFGLYRDGDGDGVLNRDIKSGVDPEVAPPRRLLHLGSFVDFGFPPDRRVRDPGSPNRWLDTEDPIRFNDSDLASFGPLGTSTPGSLYLTDGKSRLAAVRVFGRTGKVKILTYDFEEEVWR
jgi:prepilin-type N-terminal cleavage/methylation domain-containing protein